MTKESMIKKGMRECYRVASLQGEAVKYSEFFKTEDEARMEFINNLNLAQFLNHDCKGVYEEIALLVWDSEKGDYVYSKCIERVSHEEYRSLFKKYKVRIKIEHSRGYYKPKEEYYTVEFQPPGEDCHWVTIKGNGYHEDSGLSKKKYSNDHKLVIRKWADNRYSTKDGFWKITELEIIDI